MITRLSRCGTKYRRATSRTCSAVTFWMPSTYVLSNSGSPVARKLRPRLSAACLHRLPAEDQLGGLLLLGLGQLLRADQLVAQPVDLAEDLVRRPSATSPAG